MQETYAKPWPTDKVLKEIDGKGIKATEFPSMVDAQSAAKRALAAGAEKVTIGRIPNVGDRVTIDGLEYEVKARKSRGRLTIKLLGA